MRRTRTRTNVRRAFVVSACVIALALALTPWAPAVPAAPVITAPAAGTVYAAVSGYRQISFEGTAAPGATVEVFEDTTSLVTETADAAGVWKSATAAWIRAGSHSVFAVATENGVASAPSEIVTFIIDAQRPVVSVATPEDGCAAAGSRSPGCAFVYKPGETVTVSGTASDNNGVAAVRLEYWKVDKLAFTSFASCPGCATRGSSVTWSHTPTLPQAGVYQVKADAIDVAGLSSIKQARSFVTSAVSAPVSPPGTPETPTITTPGPGTIQPGTQPTTFSGTAPSGSKVTLVEQIQGLGQIGTTETSVGDGTTGVWRIRVMLSEGTYGVAARTTTVDGVVGPLGGMVAFSVDSTAPSLTVATESPVVFLPGQPVELSGTISDNYRVSRVRVDYYFLDQVVHQGFATCEGCGTSSATWTHRPQLSRPGTYYVKVFAIDVAGNSSPAQNLTIVKTT